MSLPINISASRGAAVLGLSKYQTPVQIWLQICEARRPGFCAERGHKLPVVEENAAMRWGSAFESVIIELAEAKTGLNISDREKLVSANKYVTCHLDGVYTDGVIHEGKTTNGFAFREFWGEPGTDKIPQEYQVQVQHQLLCTGASEAIVSVLVFPVAVDELEKVGWLPEDIPDLKNKIYKYYLVNNEIGRCVDPIEWAVPLSEMGFFHQYRIKADKKLHKKLLTHYKYFWNTYVIPEIEPPIKDYEDIRLLCPEPYGTIVLPEQIENWKKEYNDITKELGKSGSMERRREELKTAIGAFLVSRFKAAKPDVDPDSKDKFILRSQSGEKMGSFDGRTFR